MAASELIYNTTDPKLYTPDFSFLRYILDKSQARYDQGLEAVSSSYNSLKRDLTDPINQQRRDGFLKQAQVQLQKIASSDLSLSENVNTANSIFEPLATNQAFIFDAYHTDRIKKEMAQMQEWKNSEDYETRKKYNPEIEKWLSRDLDVLKNGNGDINNYKAMKNRSAFAYVDPQDLLIKAAKDQGFQFKMDSVGNPYIVTTEGGTEGVPNYNAFAEAVLGGDSVYQTQLGILGEARQEEIKERFKANPLYANKKDDEIYYAAGLASYDDHRKSSETLINNLNKNYEKQKASLEAFLNVNSDKLQKGYNDLLNNNGQTPEAVMYNQYLKKATSLNDLSKNIFENKNKFNENFGDGTVNDLNRTTYAENFSKNPKAFYADQQYRNDIQRFSNIKASSISVKITPDSAYTSILSSKNTALRNLNDAADDLQDNAMDIAKLEKKQREFDTKLKGKETVVNPDGTTTTKTKEADVTVLSASARQLYTIEKINKIKTAIELEKTSATNNMINPGAGALNILAKGGLSQNDLALIKDSFIKFMNSDDRTKAVGVSKETLEAYGRAFTIIQATAANAGIVIEDGELSKFNSRTLPDYLEKFIKGYKFSDNSDYKMKASFVGFQENITELGRKINSFNVGKQAIIDHYKDFEKYPEFKGFIVEKGKDNNGKPKYDLIDEKDISKQLDIYLPNLTKKEKEKFISDYLNGTLKHSSEINTYSGSTGGYSVNSNRTYSFVYQLSDGTILKQPISAKTFSIFNNIPTPEKYKELTKKINNELTIPEYQDENGMMLANPRYSINIKSELGKDFVKDLNEASQTNANIMEYKAGTAEATQVDPEEQNAVRLAMKDPENIVAVDVFTASTANNGGLAVAVTIKGKTKDDPNKQYYFPININQTTPEALSRFAMVDEVGDFYSYRQQGKQYPIDLFETDGIKAYINPNVPGSTVGTIQIMYKPWDDVQKKYSDDFVVMPVSKDGDELTYNESTMTISEIKNLILENKIYPYLRERLARLNAIKKSEASSQKFPTLDKLLITY